jgi:hypothetical protein
LVSRAARPCAGRAKLGERLPLERGRAAAVGHVDRNAQRVARLDWAPRTPQRGAERTVRTCALDRCSGAVEDRDGVAQQRDLLVASLIGVRVLDRA